MSRGKDDTSWPLDMRFSLDLPRETLSIPVMRMVLGDTLRGLGISEHCVTDILVALSEACTNVVQHAGATSRFEVTADIDRCQCALTVVDHGRGFSGRSECEVDADSESGRGITIMRALVDAVSFDSAPESGTVVHLRKRLSWRDERPARTRTPQLLKTAG